MGKGEFIVTFKTFVLLKFTVANLSVPGFNFSVLSLPAMQRKFTRARARARAIGDGSIIVLLVICINRQKN